MTKTEEIVTKLSKDFHVLKKAVEGNGDKRGSIIGRLSDLEDSHKTIIDKLTIMEGKPCREPCIFEEWKEAEDKLKDKKRTFRSGDIANYIELAVLFLIAYGMFFQ